MPGAWVFPGGVIEPGDDAAAPVIAPGGDPDHGAWIAAAVRELLEETGIWLSAPPVVVPAGDDRRGGSVERLVAGHGPVDGSRFHHLATWITPTMVPVRFHTRFSVTDVDDEPIGDPDGLEVDRVEWFDPAAIIAAADAGDVPLPLPTRHTLARFAALATAEAVIGSARNTPAPVIQPRLRVDGDVLVALLPGDPGYDTTPDHPPDPEAMARAVDVRAADGAPVPEIRPVTRRV
jgi:8-oxo-dGTP pyrophosphatase MutT (NUDIX family)